MSRNRVSLVDARGAHVADGLERMSLEASALRVLRSVRLGACIPHSGGSNQARLRTVHGWRARGQSTSHY